MIDNQEVYKLKTYIDNNNKTKILFCLPESAGDILLSTSLLSSLHDMYDSCDVYYACKEPYMAILEDNPYIYKTIPYMTIMENQILMEGTGDWPGLFDISFMVPIFTQRYLNYLNNGLGKIAFNLRK
jgi:hypothetical protein